MSKNKYKSNSEFDVTLMDKISLAVAANVPIMIWSGPGTGKTSTANKFAQKMNYHIETVIASLYDPTDFSGYPYIYQKPDGDSEVRVSIPFVIKSLEEKAKEGKRTLLFLDELPTAPRPVQNVLLRLILERKIGDYKLPDDCRIIAAGNPTSVAGNINFSSAMANRFTHVKHTPNIIEYNTQDVIEPFSLSDNPNDPADDSHFDFNYHFTAAKALISSYLEMFPKNLFAEPEEITSFEDNAFSTPRSWEAVERILAVLKCKVTPTAIELIRGTVTKQHADELFTFINNVDIENFRFETLDENSFKFSDDPSFNRVVINAAAGYCEYPVYRDKATTLLRRAYDQNKIGQVIGVSKIAYNNLIKSGLSHEEAFDKVSFISEVFNN